MAEKDLAIAQKSSISESSLITEPLDKKLHVIEQVVQLVPQGGFTILPLNTMVGNIAKTLKIEAAVTYLSSEAKITVTDASGSASSTVPISRGLNSFLLDEVESIAIQIEMKKFCSVHEIIEAFEKAKKKPYYYHPLVDLLFFTTLGVSIPLFFAGGSANDIWLAAILGLIVGLFNFAPMILPSFSGLVDFASTFAISFLAAFACQNKNLNFHFFPLWIGAIILPIPGFSLAIGFVEIAAGHTLNGTGQLFRSTTCLLGMAVATYLGIIAGYPNVAQQVGFIEFFRVVRFGKAAYYGGAALFGLSVGMLMRSKIKHLPLILASTMAMALMLDYLDYTLLATSEFFGVLILYCLCQLLAPFMKQPVYSALFVCMLPFCPGSMLARGIIFVYTTNTQVGLNLISSSIFALIGITFAMLAGQFLFSKYLSTMNRKLYSGSGHGKSAV